MRPKTWYSMGFDFSQVTGDLKLTSDVLLTELQYKLKAQLASSEETSPGKDALFCSGCRTGPLFVGRQQAGAAQHAPHLLR
jgi:hypothetical protein